MWEVEGRSTREIAQELGIKESAVRHTVSRARTSLRRILSELVVDEKRGLTALDLLSTTYKKAAKLTNKSSKIALTFILVLTAFLGFNSMTGNESNNSVITTSSSQLSDNQDIPKSLVSPETSELEITTIPTTKSSTVLSHKKSISTEEYSDHMLLSVTQLDTVALMLQVLEQADGGGNSTE
jgi:hypothetical protein